MGKEFACPARSRLRVSAPSSVMHQKGVKNIDRRFAGSDDILIEQCAKRN
jgi:hypothetical protein